MSQIHLLKNGREPADALLQTYCGLIGRVNYSDVKTVEVVSVVGNRFEATDDIDLCNCGVCRQVSVRFEP